MDLLQKLLASVATKGNQRTEETLQLPGGGVYVGEVKEGKPHGQGTLTGGYNTRSYVGQFQNGLKHGVGKITFSDGETYEGEFSKDLVDGNGRAVFKDGNVYEGQLDKGVMQGRGTYFYANGNKYEGQMARNKPNGQGVFTFADKTIRTGNFVDGNLDGQGKEVNWSQGYTYIGSFKNGNKWDGQADFGDTRPLIYRDGKALGTCCSIL